MSMATAMIDTGLALRMFEQMLVIRKFEEAAVDLFAKGQISGSTHPCIGQEAIPVGACAALDRSDLVLATYRGHGAAIAKGADPKALMAEVLTRTTGCCLGRGGSMHVADVSVGLLGTNAIVAGHIPIAGGVALASKLRSDGKVTACFLATARPAKASSSKRSTWHRSGSCRSCSFARTTDGRSRCRPARRNRRRTSQTGRADSAQLEQSLMATIPWPSMKRYAGPQHGRAPARVRP